MKKALKIIGIVMCLIVTILALVACNQECTKHEDIDLDGKCDFCFEDVNNGDDGGNDVPTCTHKDSNLDERCDLCGAEQLLNDGKVTYSVQISDGIGGGYGDFIVEFFRGGESFGVKRTDKEGYVYIRLSQGRYTLTLTDTQDRELVYDESALELTSTIRSLVIEAAPSIASQETVHMMGATDGFVDVNPNNSGSMEAYLVSGEGSYNIEVNPSKIVPVVWLPKYTGVYTITFQSEVGVKLTQHGITGYVQAQDITDEENRTSDESIKITIYSFHLANPAEFREETTPYVLGIKANVVEGSGTLKIEKTAETPLSHYDVPWTISNSTLPGQVAFGSELTKDSFTYVNLDGTDKAVYNQEDGLYHLNSVDGAVLYVQLKYTPTTLPGANSSEGNLFSFEGLISNGAFRVERLDDDKNVITKIDYTDHLNACLEMVNAVDGDDNRLNNAGTYYLTESMMAGIKDYGDYNGWWSGESNIFGENLSAIDTDYAWMFAVCYLAD